MTRTLLCLTTWLVACSPAPAPATNPTPPTTTPPGPATSAPTPGPSHGGDSTLAPLLVSLTARAVDAGETEVQLSLDVRRPLPYPLLVTATPPVGVSLVSGALVETIAAPPPGLVQRTFRVRGALSAASPLRVVVHGAAADGSSGVHADRRYPEELPAPPVSSPRPPPGGRPPGAVPRP